MENSGQYTSGFLGPHQLPLDLNPTNSQSMVDSFVRNSVPEIEAQVVDNRKLCILGLPWDTTDEELFRYFSSFGTLESASIIKKARTGESRGFGFVTYLSATDAQMVLMQEHSIGGRHIDAKQAVPRGSANPNRETRLFIGKLPPDLSDAELREHFEKFGKVQDAYIPKDPSTGKQGHRGFGFVTFANADDVDKVLQCAHTLRGVDVAVQCAVPKDKTSEITQARLGSLPKQWTSFPLTDSSYPSSNDSMIGVPSLGHNGQGPSIPHHPGGRFGPVNGIRAAVKGHMSRLETELGRPYPWEGFAQQNGQTSTSGREQNYMNNRIAASNAFDQAQLDRLSVNSITNSLPCNSLELDMQRSNSHNAYAVSSPDPTAQALQGLSFNAGNQHGIGLQLALLQQQQAQANERFHQHQQSIQPANPTYPPRTHQNGSLSGNLDLRNFRTTNFHNPLIGNPYIASARNVQPSRGFSQRPNNNAASNQSAGSFGGLNGMTGPPDARAGPRMFVGKLNKDITEQDIKDYMTQFGYVLDVYMPRDKIKRSEHRGFGFVTFETNAAIERVALNTPHKIKGSIVVVDEAAPRREEGSDLALDSTEQLANSLTTQMNLQSNASNIFNPSSSAAEATRLNSGIASGSPASSHYLNRVTSPSAASHNTASPRTFTSVGNPGTDQHFMQSSFDNIPDYNHEYQLDPNFPVGPSQSSSLQF